MDGTAGFSSGGRQQCWLSRRSAGLQFLQRGGASSSICLPARSQSLHPFVHVIYQSIYINLSISIMLYLPAYTGQEGGAPFLKDPYTLMRVFKVMGDVVAGRDAKV